MHRLAVNKFSLEIKLSALYEQNKVLEIFPIFQE